MLYLPNMQCDDLYQTRGKGIKKEENVKKYYLFILMDFMAAALFNNKGNFVHGPVICMHLSSPIVEEVLRSLSKSTNTTL